MAGTPWLYLALDTTAELDLDGTGRLVRAVGDPGPLRFAGQRHDEFAELCYQRYRHYAPDLGVFTTADPIGLAGSVFDVGFVPNPTSFVDPLGLRTAVIVGGEWIDNAGELGYMDDLAAFHANELGATVIDASELTAGSNVLQGYDTLIIDAHGGQGAILVSDQVGVAHGMVDDPSALVTGEEFGNRLKDAGLEPGARIKFNSCNSGDAGPNGLPPVAQKVAEITQSTVEAPQSLAQVPEDFLLDSSNLGAVPEDWVGLEYCQQMPDGTWQSAGRFAPGQIITEANLGMAVDTASAGQTATFGTNFADVYIPLGDWVTFKP
jgi:RHS repeat-associated protein